MFNLYFIVGGYYDLWKVFSFRMSHKAQKFDVEFYQIPYLLP